MITIRDWVASIPPEEKSIAYVGEGQAVSRQFLLTGEGWEAYRDWAFHLDMAFDLSTVTRRESFLRETTQQMQNENFSESGTSESSSNTTGTRTAEESGSSQTTKIINSTHTNKQETDSETTVAADVSTTNTQTTCAEGTVMVGSTGTETSENDSTVTGGGSEKTEQTTTVDSDMLDTGSENTNDKTTGTTTAESSSSDTTSQTDSTETASTSTGSATTTTTKETRTVTEVEVNCTATTDIASLDKEVTEEGILLTWLVLRQQTQLPGRLRATLRAVGTAGEVKKSAIMIFEVEPSVSAEPAAVVTESEFEQMEQRMDGIMSQTAAYASAASGAFSNAKLQADKAVAAKEEAATFATDAGFFAAVAEDNKDQTAAALEAAIGARDKAIDARDEAIAARDEIILTVAETGVCRDLAVEAKEQAVEAKEQAAVAAAAAGVSEANAITCATTASNSAEAASESAITATNSATAAAASAQAAKENADSAAGSWQGAAFSADIVKTKAAQVEEDAAQAAAHRTEAESAAAAAGAAAAQAQAAATQAQAAADTDWRPCSANAIRCQEEGKLLRVNDVSPLEHIATVSVVARNIIPYPFVETTKTENGITFTDNRDGSITANGVSESGVPVNIYLVQSLYLPAGTYRLSSGGATQHGLVIFTGNALNEEGVSLHQSPAAEPVEFTVVTPGEVSVRVELFEADNLTFKPEITVVPTTVQVLCSGKNLLAYPYRNTGEMTKNGITFTDNGDGTIIANGTAITSNPAQYVLVASASPLFLIPGTYTFSGGINGRHVAAYAEDGSYTHKVWFDTRNGPVTITIEEGDAILNLYCTVDADTTVENKVFSPCIEVGPVATGYEAYTAPEVCTVAEDGTVGVELAADKDVTLYTNQAGVTIRCNYNRDLNEVIHRLLQRITTLEQK